MVPILEPIVSLGDAAGASGSRSIDGLPERDQVMMEYLSTMKQLVETQREVMLGYLGRMPAPAVAATSVVLADAEAPLEVVVEEAEVPVVDLREALLGIVSERTGYPVEMLDMDLDLEADLSIDSIKRIEILGALGEQLGLSEEDGGARDEMIEQLAGIKTLRGIVEWLEQTQQSTERADVAVEPVAPKQLEAPAEIEDAIEVHPLSRYVLTVEQAPEPTEAVTVEGQRVAIVRDRAGVAESLSGLLERRGATVTLLEPGQAPSGDVDGLIYLYALTPNGVDPAKALFEAAQEAVRGGATTLIAATALGGAFGRSAAAQAAGGIAGLVKTVAKEYPQVHARVVDLDPHETADALAAHVYAEVLAGDDLIEVGYHDGARRILNVVEQPVKAPNGSSKQLDADAVVLITGGARGITAKVATALAQRFRCKMVLVGRSPLPEAEEDTATAVLADAASLRRHFAAAGQKPRAIEKTVRKLLAARQIRGTFQAIEAAGGSVEYHAVDVRDRRAFGELIDGIYQRHGRLDGVVHGAGVLEDKLIEHKTSDSFSRVYDTKVSGARTLADHLHDDVGFVVFFSSVSGAFGNRGQVDYAAANDALDKLAHTLDQRLDGRVVSINWGPWGGDGMVTPELEREYARRGIGLIEPDGGVEAFVDEILDAQRCDPQVIFMAAAPEQLQ